MDHGVKVASVLANSFSRRCSYIAESDAHVKEKAIQFGFVLGKFWSDSAISPHSLSFTLYSLRECYLVHVHDGLDASNVSANDINVLLMLM